MKYLAALICTWLAATVPAIAQSLQTFHCTGEPDIAWAQQIAGCSEAITSRAFAGRELAPAYKNRGKAYYFTKDYDRAIADYTDAIKLDPAFAHAFNDRGAAYRAKGDYDHAIADYDQVLNSIRWMRKRSRTAAPPTA